MFDENSLTLPLKDVDVVIYLLLDSTKGQQIYFE